ncbi:Fic family protein [Echinicola strongylocentroti]|uniref:Fic family protein n=1 Tax=Echinicola strongylocentroti TaxID=1795355 RepID=A0A2Z4IJZ9_9BACT|nr:Fic family protein [Echinicola strongylocentroti]AWW31010.1 Fic family protein [Echinicola strongylocentroti]
MIYNLPHLPLNIDLETKAVLKKTALARSALAEMKGIALSIPNENILISTLSLQEAKDSSAIENIITTHDELFQADYLKQSFKTLASKEVYSYADALREGFHTVREREILTSNHILQIQEMIEENRAGFRKLPGTALKNESTGETVYTPPQTYDEIVGLMNNLEVFMNDDNLSDWDPLVKMAVIHHQFESIHPFYDGNGRTGRIINILYLVKEGLINLPILYLSRYINQNKGDYYRLLQEVRTSEAWEEWVLFILEGIEQTSLQTIKTIEGIKALMQKTKHKLRRDLPKIYSQDLLNNLFRHPYTKIDFVMTDLAVSRPTATRYLEELVAIDIVEKIKLGKENYYINQGLFHLLANVNNGT